MPLQDDLVLFGVAGHVIERQHGNRGHFPSHDALIEEVWRIVLDDIVYLPLHHQVMVWAMREDLELPVYPMGSPIFNEARLN